MSKNSFPIGRIKYRSDKTQKIQKMSLSSITMKKVIIKMREISTFWI